MPTEFKSKLRSKDTPVGVFTRDLDWREDAPIYFISLVEARRLRKTGGWYSCNSGKDIGEAGEAPILEVAEYRQKSKWAILGQTSRPFARRGRIGPGFPQWVLAR